jgi:hypothetical protein
MIIRGMAKVVVNPRMAVELPMGRSSLSIGWVNQYGMLFSFRTG